MRVNRKNMKQKIRQETFRRRYARAFMSGFEIITKYTVPVMAVFFLAFIPAAAALAAAQAMSADSSPDVDLEHGKAEAAALLKNGEADKAYELYMRLFRAFPDDDAACLGLARAAVGAGRWNQAVMAYETLLEKYHGDAGLYGELAQVYMRLGDRVTAERSFAMMRAMDGTSTVQETDRTLDILARRYSSFQARGNIRTGIQYDSNANLGPGSNDLYLGDWLVSLDNAAANDSAGAYLGVNIDLGKRFSRDGPLWLVGDAQGFWRGHAESELKETRSREAQWGRASAGLRHLSSTTLAEMRIKTEIFDYEFHQRVASHGMEGTFLWANTSYMNLIIKGSLDWRGYSRDHTRDGLYGSAGLYGRVFFGAGSHEALLGGRYLGANADREDYGYNGWEAPVRITFKLPRGFELASSVSYTREFYKGPATALEKEKRLDDRLRAGLGLTYHVNEAWSLEAGYQYSRNHSTSALYCYGQHFVNTGIIWSFR